MIRMARKKIFLLLLISTEESRSFWINETRIGSSKKTELQRTTTKKCKHCSKNENSIGILE